MKGLLVSSLVLLLLAAARAADDPTASLKGVADLTPETFDKIVNGRKGALVEFYAPWCGHCKHLTPEYKKLGETITADPKLDSRLVVAKVDADKHRSLGERFGVSGFPTIKYFPRGQPTDKPEDYRGARTAEGMQSFLEERVAADGGFARVEALDGLAQAFLGADDKAKVVAEAEAAAGKLEGDQAEYGALYVKFMKKAQEKGDEYFAKETSRLERMLETGSVGGTKLSELSQKLSVLQAFMPNQEVSAEE